MGSGALNLLTVSIADRFGGAEQMAWELFRSYRARGHRSWMAVGEKHSDDPDVFALPRPVPGPWFRLWRGVRHRLQALDDRWPGRGAGRLATLTQDLGQPGKWYDRVRGYEDFRFPATYRLLGLCPEKPDVIHCHNLHNYYFDLRALPWLSRQAPVVLSLHDSWLLSGLCGHPFDCERWKTGCGRCPYLTVWQEPAWSRRDATAANWRRKRAIFARSRLYVTTACRWLMRRVEQSVLTPAVMEAKVIPYGVDLAVFQPADRRAVRAELGVPAEARVLFFVARGLAANPSKDYATLRAAVERLGARWSGAPLFLIARGEDLPAERLGSVHVRYVPWAPDPRDVVRYYQAADVYLHAARMDTFPLSVLEAQACGTPALATAVGGIPEQVRSLDAVEGDASAPAHGADEATGVLVPPGEPDLLARSIERLLADEALRARLGQNAWRAVRERFDLQRQVSDYLQWYADIADRCPARPRRNGDGRPVRDSRRVLHETWKSG
jgi:glycosyltransferase involved in cell wall biosynthesis